MAINRSVHAKSRGPRLDSASHFRRRPVVPQGIPTSKWGGYLDRLRWLFGGG